MPLRIGSLSERARPLTSGYDRESRRLKRKGFTRAAEALALEGSKDRLQNGNIQSSEDKAESEQIAEQAARLDRRLRYNALKGADGTKAIQNSSTQGAASITSQSGQTSKPEFGIPNPAPLPEVPLTNSARPFGKDDAAGRQALRSEFERINPSSEPGNLAELQRSRSRSSASVAPAPSGETTPQGKTLGSWIDEFKKARESTQALLEKPIEPVAVTEPTGTSLATGVANPATPTVKGTETPYEIAGPAAPTSRLPEGQAFTTDEATRGADRLLRQRQRQEAGEAVRTSQEKALEDKKRARRDEFNKDYNSRENLMDSLGSDSNLNKGYKFLRSTLSGKSYF